jgi:cytochrome P450
VLTVLDSDGCTNYMHNKHAGSEWADLTKETLHINPFVRQYPWFVTAMQSLPEWLLMRLQPTFAPFVEWDHNIRVFMQRAAKEAKANPEYYLDPAAKHRPDRTLFHELALTPNLSAADKKLERLGAEATMVVSAGGETTAQVISRTFYHVVANWGTAGVKLREELKKAMPDPKAIPKLSVLQTLPYLNAVWEEGLRLSVPVPARVPRVFPEDDLVYVDKGANGGKGKQWVVPKGCAVSMSQEFVMMNAKVFPEPKKFRPERWLEDDGKGGLRKRKDMLKYSVGFGKGRRACLGKK